ncbi:hypothetical protein C2E23DRAFT_738885 [Lenzites betulinus]|nr:hypothetical protein C2E23DRAFT_738885 [Lenzites betulinus]
MYTVFFAAVLLQGLFVSSVQATLYVTQPRAASSCSGGKPCTVEWLDDGTAPFLSQIGPCSVGLYNGAHVLVQQIAPVDISAVHSLQFTPDPHAGPNSSN